MVNVVRGMQRISGLDCVKVVIVYHIHIQYKSKIKASTKRNNNETTNNTVVETYM